MRSRYGQEEKVRQARVDPIRCARIEIAGEEEGWCCQNFQGVEANRWRNRGQGASTWGIPRHPGMNSLLAKRGCQDFCAGLKLFGGSLMGHVVSQPAARHLSC